MRENKLKWFDHVSRRGDSEKIKSRNEYRMKKKEKKYYTKIAGVW